MADLVIDASISATWCFRDEVTESSNRILDSVSGPLEATAPRLWAYEIRNIVLNGILRKRITDVDGEAFLSSLSDLRITLADPLSYESVFALARRHGLTFYDAAYLDLALREGLPLASLDRQLLAAAGKVGVSVFRP